MTELNQPSSNQLPPPPQGPARSRVSRRPLFVAAAGCAALVGLGSVSAVAAENHNSRTNSPTTHNAAPVGYYQGPSQDCSFQATVTTGNQSASAAEAFGPADAVAQHRGVDISVVRVSEQVVVGAMIEHNVFLELRADDSRQAELTDLMKSTIDSDDDFDFDNHDTVIEFRGDNCDLTSAFDEDAWVEDFFHSDSVVHVASDEGHCRFSSLFAGNDPDDFTFEDFDIGQFDLDLQISDGTFEISLDTGDGSVGLACESTD